MPNQFPWVLLVEFGSSSEAKKYLKEKASVKQSKLTKCNLCPAPERCHSMRVRYLYCKYDPSCKTAYLSQEWLRHPNAKIYQLNCLVETGPDQNNSSMELEVPIEIEAEKRRERSISSIDHSQIEQSVATQIELVPESMIMSSICSNANKSQLKKIGLSIKKKNK
ncbi:hypothetical protein BpHYR1_029653 [Brachionus plicatilis]|uniref:Uncharacterized protein n=1 Tax=Brachionus plicatilis TaxID=10195 RepID=A0A3M7PUB0_BRAPC|nr:hypothetical protein BpHYR1_029653 [Brachionus plicatilis]